MRKVRWRVDFKTIKEREASVLVYEEDWDGGVTSLQPAESVISTDEDSDESMTLPVRAQSGYLRIIDNGDISGLMPKNNRQHYVELIVNGALVWCGYMLPESFSEDWDSTPIEVEFPISSPLGVIDGKEMDRGKEMEMTTMAELLIEIIEATGVDYRYIYWPEDIAGIGERKLSFGAMELSVSRYNFFSLNDSEKEGDEEWKKYNTDSCLEVLTAICEFFGWTAREEGKDLYFTDVYTERYKKTDMDGLRYIANREKRGYDTSYVRGKGGDYYPVNGMFYLLPTERYTINRKDVIDTVNDLSITYVEEGSTEQKTEDFFGLTYRVVSISQDAISVEMRSDIPILGVKYFSVAGEIIMDYREDEGIAESVQRNSVELESLSLDGDNHKKDILQGYEKITVKAETNRADNVIPEVGYDGKKLDVIKTYDDNGNLKPSFIIYVIMDVLDWRSDEGLALYQYIANTSVAGRPIEEVEWSADNINGKYGAAVIKRDQWSREDHEKKKNYNWTECIFIRITDSEGFKVTDEQALKMPVIKIKTKQGAIYQNGAFCLSAQTSTSTLKDGIVVGTNGNGISLQIMFRVGRMYWSGTGWTSVKSTFFVPIGSEEGTSSGTGTIISTKKLTDPYNGADGYLIPITELLSGEVEITIYAISRGSYTALYLQNLKVDYYKDDNITVSDKDVNTYTRYTEGGYGQDMEVGLRMSSDNDNAAGYGIISYKGSTISDNVKYADGKTERPELHLIGNLKRIYGRIIEKLTLEMEYSARVRPWSVVTYAGKKYRVLSKATEWTDEHTSYMIEQLNE